MNAHRIETLRIVRDKLAELRRLRFASTYMHPPKKGPQSESGKTGVWKTGTEGR